MDTNVNFLDLIVDAVQCTAFLIPFAKEAYAAGKMFFPTRRSSDLSAPPSLSPSRSKLTRPGRCFSLHDALPISVHRLPYPLREGSLRGREDVFPSGWLAALRSRGRQDFR